VPVTPAGAAALVGVGVGVDAGAVLSVVVAELVVAEVDAVFELFEVVLLAEFVVVLCLVVAVLFLVVVVALLVAAFVGVVVTAAVFDELFAEVFVLAEVSAEAPASVEIPDDPNCGGVIESTAPRPPTVPPAINNARFMPLTSIPR
jgi:hypothetical protein